MRTIRAFIAVDIPPVVREQIAELQDGFKSLELDVAWVKPANFHLTLKFLGNINPDRISEINEILNAKLALTPGFMTTVGAVGMFPSLDRPRVLWVGLESQALVALQNNIDSCLVQAGFEPEPKKFSAHLTLGRIKSSKGKNILQQTLKTMQKPDIAPFTVSSVKLYESLLTAKGSIYTLLEEFKLGTVA